MQNNNSQGGLFATSVPSPNGSFISQGQTTQAQGAKTSQLATGSQSQAPSPFSSVGSNPFAAQKSSGSSTDSSKTLAGGLFSVPPQMQSQTEPQMKPQVPLFAPQPIPTSKQSSETKPAAAQSLAGIFAAGAAKLGAASPLESAFQFPNTAPGTQAEKSIPAQKVVEEEFKTQGQTLFKNPPPAQPYATKPQINLGPSFLPQQTVKLTEEVKQGHPPPSQAQDHKRSESIPETPDFTQKKANAAQSIAAQMCPQNSEEKTRANTNAIDTNVSSPQSQAQPQVNPSQTQSLDGSPNTGLKKQFGNLTLDKVQREWIANIRKNEVEFQKGVCSLHDYELALLRSINDLDLVQGNTIKIKEVYTDNLSSLCSIEDQQYSMINQLATLEKELDTAFDQYVPSENKQLLQSLSGSTDLEYLPAQLKIQHQTNLLEDNIKSLNREVEQVNHDLSKVDPGMNQSASDQVNNFENESKKKQINSMELGLNTVYSTLRSLESSVIDLNFQVEQIQKCFEEEQAI